MMNYDNTPESDLAPELPTAEGPGRGPSLPLIMERLVSENTRLSSEINAWRERHLSYVRKSKHRFVVQKARISELEKLVEAANA